MAVDVIENATVELLDFNQFAEFAADNLNYAGETELLNHVTAELRANPYNASSSLTTKEQWAEQISTKLKTAGYDVAYNGNGKWTCSAFPKTANMPAPAPNPVNSNMSTVSRGTVRSFYGGINEFDGTLQRFKPTRFPVSGGLAAQAKYFLTSVNYATGAVSAGIWLGKQIDSVLYNVNPDFWDSIGMSSLNPETWNSITNGDDSIFAKLFNMILGLDPDTGNAQMYMNQDALAYMAYYMKTQGAFEPLETAATYNPATLPSSYTFEYSLSNYLTSIPIYVNEALQTGQYPNRYYVSDNAADVYLFAFPHIASGNRLNWRWGAVSTAPFRLRDTAYGININADMVNISGAGWPNVYSARGTVGYYYYRLSEGLRYEVPKLATRATYTNYNVLGSLRDIAFLISNSIIGVTGGVPGISDQEGATLPDVSDWTDVPSTLESLQEQYPESFEEPMVWNSDSPYEDTGGSTTTYIPVPFPSIDTNGNPITGTQTQSSTLISPTTTPQPILDLIAKLLQQPTTATGTPTETVTPPTNPPDTGTGSTPVPTVPEGHASALWSVYHPTQAQVDAFGGWLWTGDIITQIQQLLQNPMDGIITLHKVFAPPVDAGNGTIVIGRLDSEVPSALVNQQYVEVDCGYVDCSEQFGNVFDYIGTKVSLYLPFIGIVPLNVSEVMRSTIHIKYGVDVFTGACLAMVYVLRDGNNVNMYQYSGVASVEYPITAGLHMGVLNGIIGVASGVAMIGASTNPMGGIIGAASVAKGAVSANTVNQSHSGGFSGNAGAMGIKKPYLIIERPQTKIASTFYYLDGYPTNYSVTLGSCNNHVKCSTVHVSGINATEKELRMIESLLKEGVEV